MMTPMMRLCALIVGCLLLAAGPRDAFAQDPFAAAAAGLAGDFSEKIEAIERLSALGDGRAVPLLQALNDGSLLVRESDRRLAIERDKDRLRRLFRTRISDRRRSDSRPRASTTACAA